MEQFTVHTHHGIKNEMYQELGTPQPLTRHDIYIYIYIEREREREREGGGVFTLHNLVLPSLYKSICGAHERITLNVTDNINAI